MTTTFVIPQKDKLHVKIYPGFNDAYQIQHADDQINDGSVIDGEPHEVPGFPIGNAIESYQGVKTVEVWWRELSLDTDGDVVYDIDGNPVPVSPTDAWDILYTERLAETVKIIQLPTVTQSTFLVFRFILRTEFGSSLTQEFDQYIYMAVHEDCGESGAP